MFLGPLIALAIVVVLGVAALFSAHIPIVARLTDAAPLLREEDTARDFAASDAAGYVVLPDWGPDPVRLELPAAEGDLAAPGEVSAP